MTSRSHPRMAVVLCLAVSLAAQADGRDVIADDDRALIEMEPARAAQEALAPIVEGPPRHVALEISAPGDGAIFSDLPVAHLWGRLDALGALGRVDAVVVIDTSLSTARKAERVDHVKRRVRGLDRRHGRKRPASILEQEVRSAVRLLEDVDPRSTRLGIVSFAGSDEGQPADATASARTEVPVTGRLEALEAGLQQVAGRGARGRTDMAAGLDRAVDELTGRGRSRPDPAAAKVVVFFTDGTPTLPHPKAADNERAVFEAAERAAAAGVRVFSFSIGPEALRRPTASVEMARRTGGVYTPVRDPRDLGAAVKSTVQLTSVRQLTVRNATLRANARDLHVGDGGIFGGLVPLKPGKNRIFVRAVAGDLSAEAERSVHYAPGAVRVWIAPRREVAPVPTVVTHRDLEITTGPEAQRRALEVRVGAQQRKDLRIGVGPVPSPAAPEPGRLP